MDIELVDKRGFYKDFLSFGPRLQKQYNMLKNFDIGIEKRYSGIVISGMGGSGVVGDIIYDLLWDVIDIPIYVNKADHLPKFVNKDFLVIAVSYSGNTMETINAMLEADKRGTDIITVSSGGKLAELSREKGILHITINKAMAPRSALPELLVGVLRILENAVNVNFKTEVEEAARHLSKIANEYTPSEYSEPMELARSLMGRIPIIYVPKELMSIGIRAKTAFNENSKVNAYFDVYPEMFHNEVMAYDYEYNRSLKLIFVEGNSKINSFFEYLVNLGADPIHIEYPAQVNRLTAILQIIMKLDLASVYLAVLRGVDPYPVRLIDWLKKK